MRKRQLGWIAALLGSSLSTAALAGGCQLAELGELPVDMQNASPLVWAKINGAKARFVLDTGAFYSTLWRNAATQYQLRITSILGGHSYYVGGLGGTEQAMNTTVKSFEFLGATARRPFQFLVIDQQLVPDSVGVLGQNILRMSDVEYDLANGVARFFNPVDCGNRPLAYWAGTTPYSTVDLEAMDAFEPTLRTTAMVNGHRITVEFDTGSPRSYLSLEAAENAGISPNSRGVTFVALGGGVGPGATKMWSAPVDTFQLGSEKVQHAHLLIQDFNPARRVGDVGRGSSDMLLGEDFFLSHRIYVAYSQRKLYFTYNGGPLFNLDLPQVLSGAAKPPVNPAATAPGSASTPGQQGSDTPADADAFRRRGVAFASMQEFGRALEDLTRACDLAPGDTQNHYQRGIVYLEDGQVKPALQDFDTVLTLQPNNIDARMARAELLQRHPDADPADAASQVKSDLDAVSRLAAPDASVRLTIGQLYGRLGDYSDGIDQINQWLSHHPLKGDQADGLNSRCWLRATGNLDLHEALDDCNRALALRPRGEAETGTLIARTVASDNPHVLDSRGLVYLRLGRLQDAFHDYDSALQIDPRMPTALFGRGLVELRAGEASQGQSDLAAAAKLDSGIAQYFAKMGLTP